MAATSKVIERMDPNLIRVVNPVAGIFPPPSEAEYAGLREGIRRHKQTHPIVLYRGEADDLELIDGRQRVRACRDLGIPVKYRVWSGKPSELLAYVTSLNCHRRSLTAGQRACVGVEVMDRLEAEALQKKRDGGRRGGRVGKHVGTGSHMSDSCKPDSRAETTRVIAARMVGSNETYVQQAKAVRSFDPDLFERLKHAQLTIPQAEREMLDRRNRSLRSRGLKEEPPSIEAFKHRGPPVPPNLISGSRPVPRAAAPPPRVDPRGGWSPSTVPAPPPQGWVVPEPAVDPRVCVSGTYPRAFAALLKHLGGRPRIHQVSLKIIPPQILVQVDQIIFRVDGVGCEAMSDADLEDHIITAVDGALGDRSDRP